MSSVYTNLAKKRAEQSTQSTENSAAVPSTQAQQQPVLPSPAVQHAPPDGQKSNCQLNAWITTNQEQLLNTAYYRLRANRVKIKKGELIGVAIEVLSRILENQSPTTLDASILDAYVHDYDKNK